MEKNIIDEIRRPGFKYHEVDWKDTVDYHWDNISEGDYTICFNDKKLDFWSQDFSDEKMATLTQGKIYQILGKKLKDNVRSGEDKCIQIINDKGKKIWILTGRFAFGPELAHNAIRFERLNDILEGDDNPFPDEKS
jgi:hypothetical protein